LRSNLHGFFSFCRVRWPLHLDDNCDANQQPTLATSKCVVGSTRLTVEQQKQQQQQQPPPPPQRLKGSLSLAPSVLRKLRRIPGSLRKHCAWPRIKAS
jgi:hypothetical protein